MKTLRLRSHNSLFINFVKVFYTYPEFRTTLYFYYKVNKPSILRLLYPPKSNLYIWPNSEISEGLVIQHGDSSIISAQKIGYNCQIWQNVTIGKARSGDNEQMPIIGNNVKICAGSIIIGGITIDDNVTIGAGSVVRSDVPANSIVIGNPGFIIKRDGVKCNIKL